MVLDRFDHHLVLERCGWNLHPSGGADARVRNVAIAGDFIAGVDDHNTLSDFIGEDAGHFAEFGGLTDAWTTQQQDRLPGANDIVDDVDGAFEGAADAAGETDHLVVAVSHTRDAMERSLDSGSVVTAKIANLPNHELDVVLGDDDVFHPLGAVTVAGFGGSAVVQDDFNQACVTVLALDALADNRGQNVEELPHTVVVQGGVAQGSDGGMHPLSV